MANIFITAFTFVKGLPTWLKKLIIYVIIVVIAFFTLRSMYNKFMEVMEDNKRMMYNMENITFELKESKALNGDLYHSVNALTVKANELERLNSNIANSVKNLDIKVKNLQSASNVHYHYSTVYDTIKSTPDQYASGKFNALVKDDYSEMATTINVVPNQIPYLTDTKIKLSDSLFIANEFIYKRKFLFWKKVVGVETHVKSENPHFIVDRIESFQIIK